MSYDAEKVAVATKSLQDAAAAALAAVESGAAPQKVWSLLTPKTQSVLRDLCAAQYSLPPPATTLASLRMPRRGLVALSEDVLGSIIAFVDLPMRFTCVAACSTFRDACARLSPRLEQSLVLKRFPLLATIGLTGAPAPRELFRTFEDFSLGAVDNSRGEAFSRAMTLHPPLDAYTLWLELELCEQETRLDGRHIWKARESFQIGAGALTDVSEGLYQFTVPDAGLYERISQQLINNHGLEGNWTIRAMVVATRRNASGQLQFAEVYRSFLTDHHGFAGGVTCMQFFCYSVPVDRKNIALEIIKRKFSDRDEFMDPCLHMDWHSESPSTIHAQWKWSVVDTFEDMDGPEASMMLEHLADWK